MTALKGQEKTEASIGSWKLFKETDELKEQMGSYLRPRSPPCFKEQNFIKLCHSVFVSRRGVLKDQSDATEELLSLSAIGVVLLHTKQQVATEHNTGNAARQRGGAKESKKHPDAFS